MPDLTRLRVKALLAVARLGDRIGTWAARRAQRDVIRMTWRESIDPNH